MNISFLVNNYGLYDYKFCMPWYKIFFAVGYLEMSNPRPHAELILSKAKVPFKNNSVKGSPKAIFEYE